ncbi:hypothetical protein GC176_04890 [bacterium]|nr:hypothetical protein [bacterium]
MSDTPSATARGGDFRVAVFSRGDDIEAMAAVLSESLGLNRVDAKIHAAHLPGLLADRLTNEQAEIVVAAVRQLGVAAAAVAQSDVPQLNHPETIHRAACLDDGLEIIGLSGARSGFIAWPDLEFISVGYVPLEGAHHYAPESPVVLHSAPHEVEEQSEGVAVSGPVCWFIARNPQRIYFLNHSRMNYDYLADRKSSSAAANFSEFLTDLTGSATTAYLTPATRAILHHGSASDYLFKDAEQFKQATILQYLLHTTVAAAQLPEHS